VKPVRADDIVAGDVAVSATATQLGWLVLHRNMCHQAHWVYFGVRILASGSRIAPRCSADQAGVIASINPGLERGVGQAPAGEVDNRFLAGAAQKPSA
jgi:hypothetical protein